MTQEEQIYLRKFAQEFKNRKGIAPERQHLHYALKKYRGEQPSLADVKETGMPEFMQPQPQPAEAVSTAVKPVIKSTEEKKAGLEKAWELIEKGWEEAGRPFYAISNVVKFAQDPETYYKTHNIKKSPYSFRAGIGQSFWEGLTKKEKATVSESFDEALTYMPEKWWVLRGTFKTIGDISDWVTDPRYWLIGKVAGKVLKGAIKAAPEKVQKFLTKPRKLFKGKKPIKPGAPPEFKPTTKGPIETAPTSALNLKYKFEDQLMKQYYGESWWWRRIPKKISQMAKAQVSKYLEGYFPRGSVIPQRLPTAKAGPGHWDKIMSKYVGSPNVKMAEYRYVASKLPYDFLKSTPSRFKWVKGLDEILKNLEKAGMPNSVETLVGAIEQANYFVAPGVAAIIPEEEVIRKPPGAIEGEKPLIEEVYPKKKVDIMTGKPIEEGKPPKPVAKKTFNAGQEVIVDPDIMPEGWDMLNGRVLEIKKGKVVVRVKVKGKEKDLLVDTKNLQDLREYIEDMGGIEKFEKMQKSLIEEREKLGEKPAPTEERWFFDKGSVPPEIWGYLDADKNLENWKAAIVALDTDPSTYSVYTPDGLYIRNPDAKTYKENFIFETEEAAMEEAEKAFPAKPELETKAKEGEIEKPMREAIKVLPETVSSGFHEKFSKEFNGIDPSWAIVFTGRISPDIKQAAINAGLKINEREIYKGAKEYFGKQGQEENAYLTDVYLPNVKQSEIQKATNTFNQFAENYKKSKLELKAEEVKLKKPAPKVTQETITGKPYIPPKEEVPGAEIKPGDTPLFETGGVKGAEQLRLGSQEKAKKTFNPLTGEEELIEEELPAGETKYEAGKYYGAFGEEISKKDHDFLYGEGEETLYQVIKREGGIKSYKKGMPGALREEYLEVPIHLRRNKGLALDEMADVLKNRYPHFGIESEADLISALADYKRGGGIQTSADVGGYATSPSAKFALPELTEIASELMEGKYPHIVKHIRAAGGLATGVFRARKGVGKGEIQLKADIFSSLEEAEKTLAHEIGHLVDWLPDKTLKRGNILGRIGTLVKYLKTLLEEAPDSREHALTPKERSKIRNQATKRARKEGATGDELKSITARMYAEMIDEEIINRGLITRAEVMEELQVLSQRWKPFDETNEEMIKYRFSPKELYADAISVLLNDPKLLQEAAPIFYKGFFNYLGRKPAVKKVYNEILALAQGEETIYAHRQERTEAMDKKGENIFRAKRNERKKRDIIEALRYAFYNRNVAGETAAEKAIKKGIEVKPEDNPIYAIEEMVYSTSEGEAYMGDVNKIFKNLRNNDLTWDDLGHVLLHERIVNQRVGMANPLGFTPKTSARQLQYIHAKIGDRKWQVLQNAVKNFRDVRKYVIDRAEESHFVSEELIKRMRENPHYAHFLVLHYYQDKFGVDLSGRIMPQTGVLAEVANAATATVMKDLAILKDITRQEAAHKLVGIIQQGTPEDIKDPELKFNGKAMVPVKPPRGSDWRLIVYSYDGKLQSHYVRPQVAAIFNRSPEMVDEIGKSMSIGNRIFRELYVGINYGFMAFNAIRDFVRLSKTMPGKVFFFNVIKPYLKAIPAAIRRGWGLDDPTIKEMLRKKMLITVGGRFSVTTEDKQMEWLLQRYEFMGMSKHRNAIIKPFYKLFNGLHNIGQTIETVPKVAGYRYLSKLGFDEKVVGHRVRTMAGSPDFLRKGRLAGIYNNLLLFSNPMIQGWAGDIEALKIDPVGYTGKTVQVNLIPKILMYLAAIGALGAGIKKIFDGMSEYDKTNYTCIPLGLTESGKSVYLRVPQDEVGRVLSGILWKGLTSRRAQDIQQLGDYTAGQIPSLSPYLGMGMDILQYATGKNPYNWFKGRYVMNETVFEAGGWRSHREFLKYLAKQGGINLVYRFPRDDDVKIKSDLEKILGYPIVNNIVGRFLKVSDYGIREQVDEALQDVRKEKAKEIIEARDAIVKIVKGESERITGNEWISLAKHPNLKDRNLEILLTRRYGTTYLDMLNRAKNDEERIAVWKTIMKLEPKHKPEIEKVLQP